MNTNNNCIPVLQTAEPPFYKLVLLPQKPSAGFNEKRAYVVGEQEAASMKAGITAVCL
jgi:hypothetical protein